MTVGTFSTLWKAVFVQRSPSFNSIISSQQEDFVRLGRAVWVADPAFARKLGCVEREERERGREGALPPHVAHSFLTDCIPFLSFIIFVGVNLLPVIAYLWKAGVG